VYENSSVEKRCQDNEKGAFGIAFSVQLAASSTGKIAGINLQSPNRHNPNQHLFTTKIVKIIVPVWLFRESNPSLVTRLSRCSYCEHNEILSEGQGDMNLFQNWFISW
jgi:hypothetical protein